MGSHCPRTCSGPADRHAARGSLRQLEPRGWARRRWRAQAVRKGLWFTWEKRRQRVTWELPSLSIWMNGLQEECTPRIFLVSSFSPITVYTNSTGISSGIWHSKGSAVSWHPPSPPCPATGSVHSSELLSACGRGRSVACGLQPSTAGLKEATKWPIAFPYT